MVNLTSFRNKIETKVFTGLGSTASLYSIDTAASVDKWGDNVPAYTLVSSSVVTVPWNLFSDRESFQPFGEMSEGEMDMAFKYDQTLSVGYKVVLLSNNYLISQVEDFPLKDGLLVKIARLRKEHQ